MQLEKELKKTYQRKKYSAFDEPFTGNLHEFSNLRTIRTRRRTRTRQVAISVDVTNLEVSTKVNSLQESAVSLARSHHFQDLSEESYLSAFESPEAWEKTPEEERQLYTNTWFLTYLQSRCGSRGVDRKSLDYYETPGLRHAIRDAVERKHASKEKKRLRDLASYSFKKIQEQAYLSSRNPDVAKAAAEKKEADLKANRDKAGAKVCSNTVNYDLVSNKIVSQMLFCGLNFVT